MRTPGKGNIVSLRPLPLPESGRSLSTLLSRGTLSSVDTASHSAKVRFSDQAVGVHDFSVMVQEQGPLVTPLRDPDYFARVFLDLGAPTWPNGFDVAPNGCAARWRPRES